MVKKKTNRTEGIFIRVSQEIKRDIERRTQIGLKISDWFEEQYMSSFMYKQHVLDKIASLRKEIQIYEGNLSEINCKEESEKKVTLMKKELQTFFDSVSKFREINDQLSAFNYMANRNITKEEFIKIKKRYID